MVAMGAPSVLDSKTALKLCTKLTSGVESRASQTAAIQLAQLLQRCPGLELTARCAGAERCLPGSEFEKVYQFNTVLSPKGR